MKLPLIGPRARGPYCIGPITNGLCESRVARIYKTLARKAGLPESIIQGISGHSMRVDEAQDLLTRGAGLPQIMVKVGWAKAGTVISYVERMQLPISGKTNFLS